MSYPLNDNPSPLGLLITYTPLNQMGFLGYQTKLVKKIYFFIIELKQIKNISVLKMEFRRDFGCGIRQGIVVSKH